LSGGDNVRGDYVRGIMSWIQDVYIRANNKHVKGYQFQNFNFSAVVAPLVVRTKNQSYGNYETCKLHATRHLGPYKQIVNYTGSHTCCAFLGFWKLQAKSWGDQYIVGPQPKSWGPVSPGPHGCCAYVHVTRRLFNSNILEISIINSLGVAEGCALLSAVLVAVVF